MAKKKKKPITITEKFNDDGELVYRIDKVKKTGVYHITEAKSKQLKVTKSFKLDGFSSFPRNILSPNGWGFTHVGTQLMEHLAKEITGKVILTVSATKSSSITKNKSSHSITISEKSLRQVNSLVTDARKSCNREVKNLAYEFLVDQFPKHFSGTTSGNFKYRPNKIGEMLGDSDVVNNLSDSDKVAIQNIYPQLLEEMVFTVKAPTKVQVIAKGIKASKKVYLKKIIDEFENKLGGTSSEATWQKFLHDHILTLINTYAQVIEKQSVEIDGKYPDFMLVDAYGYLDVYEIKKPQTKLLKYDQGRKNYYWDAEIARAITQTEKYMSSVQKNRLQLEAKFRKSKLDVRIVRPRGFIIVGKRSDLKDEDMQEDFRILNDSLKNIDIICFDDLLDNLKALLDRLTN